jgi:subtilase family serine protease
VNANAGYLDVWSNQPTAQTCGAFGEQWIEIGSIAAGATKTLRVNLQVKDIGNKTIRAFADSWCQTPESKETNNQMTKSYTVKTLP